MRAINAVGGVAGRFGLRAGLESQGLLDAASKRTGLTDFGPDDGWREGLRRLTAALDGEARLTALGRVAARQRLVSLLETRLRLQAVADRVADQQVTAPVFVLGLPRTGTTVLYGMLDRKSVV